MRIDDEFESESILNFNEQNIENTMNEIDKLISDISLSERSLRKRNVNSIYLSSNDLDDIDDVIINIKTPDEYYTNNERRIVKYNDYNLIVYVISLFSYLIAITMRAVMFLIKIKKS